MRHVKRRRISVVEDALDGREPNLDDRFAVLGSDSRAHDARPSVLRLFVSHEPREDVDLGRERLVHGALVRDLEQPRALFPAQIAVQLDL